MQNNLVHQPARVRQAAAALLGPEPQKLLLHVREAICEPTRSQIVCALSAGPLRVDDLAAVIRRSKSATSQHLRVLRDHGLVVSRRKGRAVQYSLAEGPASKSAVAALSAIERAA